MSLGALSALNRLKFDQTTNKKLYPIQLWELRKAGKTAADE
jgi:hypothetical protein